MKEELQTKLVEILGSIQTAAGKAGDFAMVQLPDIAQQYVVYGRAYTLVLMLGAMAIFCLGFYCVHLTKRKVAAADAKYAEAMKQPNSYVSRSHFFEWSDVGPFPFIPFVVGVTVFGINLSQTLLVWFAPKVWLLKEIADLIK